MKILRIVYDWPPPWLGLAPHPYELTVSQLKQGDEVTVFCGRWPKAGELEVPEGLKIFPIWREPIPDTVFFTSSIALFFKYLSFRKKKENKVDMIHCHGHFGVWIYLYRKFLKKYMPWSDELMTPLVVHFHNTAAGRKESLEKIGRPKITSQLIGWPMSEYSDRLAADVADACVFVSDQLKQEAITHYGVKEDKCFVIESGVNPKRFTKVAQNEKEKSRHDLGLDMFDKVILYLGYLVERKGVHKLVEMMSFLPPYFKLVLVGSGDPSYVQIIQETIRKRGLENRVLRVGYTPYPQAPIAYQMSDLFVLPSEFEGMPKVLMESLSCGVPVLVSKAVKVSQDISGLENIDNNDDPKDLAAQVKSMIDNPPIVESTKIWSTYSWDMRAKELKRVYDYAKDHFI